MTPTETADLLLTYFRGRDDHVAAGNPDGSFRPAKLTGPLTPQKLANLHLGGRQCLGFYLMTPGSAVFATCTDFDNKETAPDPEWKDKALAAYLWLQSAGLRPVAEISASGNGAHVWLFLESPAPAWMVRAFWGVVSRQTGVTFKEVYPRQDMLTDGGLGNLVRYPLWNQSRFVDPEEEWATVAPEVALRFHDDPADVRRLASDFGVQVDVLEKQFAEKPAGAKPSTASEHPADLEIPARVKARLGRQGSLLARRWAGDMEGLKDPSRSALVESIACELVRQYVPTHDIATAIRWWCADHEYEKGLRDDWIDRTVLKAYDFTVSRVEEKSTSTVLMRDACHAYISQLEKGAVTYVRSGIGDLDDSIDGVAPGEMAVIAARPGQGKSVLGIQWIDAATARGLNCLLVSEEMGALDIGKRALASLSLVHQADWTKSAVPVLRKEVDRHYSTRARAFIVEGCNTIDRAEDVIEQHVGLHGVKVVAVDYLQLLGARGAKRYEQVSDVSRRLKQCARRNNVVMLALCQLNREVEGRDSKEPRLSDLRDSGQLEQDADLVLFLQWPHRFDSEAARDEYRIYIAKRRNGPIRKSKIITTFSDDRQHIGPIVWPDREDER